MKKTLLALAAIAASSAAFAQSSVTLYGVVDASVESVRANDTVTRVSSDNLSSSRLGFKGTEDLGGGTKAIFALETQLNLDTGAAGSTGTPFWGRQAWVGIGGTFGELRLGRTDSLIGDIAGNVLSAQGYDDLRIVPTRAGTTYRRTDNAITYTLPGFVPGLTAAVQYSTGATTAASEIAGDDAGRSIGISIKYAAGPLSAGIGYLNVKDEVADTVAVGSQKANATLAYAGYDFGAAKITAYYDAESRSTAKRLSLAGAKVAIPFTPEFTFIVSGATARNVNGSATGSDNVQITTLKGIYSLSKRTAAYAMFTNVNNDTATALVPGYSPPAGAADLTSRAFAVGFRHTF